MSRTLATSEAWKDTSFNMRGHKVTPEKKQFVIDNYGEIDTTEIEAKTGLAKSTIQSIASRNGVSNKRGSYKNKEIAKDLGDALEAGLLDDMTNQQIAEKYDVTIAIVKARKNELSVIGGRKKLNRDYDEMIEEYIAWCHEQATPREIMRWFERRHSRVYKELAKKMSHEAIYCKFKRKVKKVREGV